MEGGILEVYEVRSWQTGEPIGWTPAPTATAAGLRAGGEPSLGSGAALNRRLQICQDGQYIAVVVIQSYSHIYIYMYIYIYIHIMH